MVYKRNIIIPFFTFISISALGILYFFDPMQYSFYPACVFKLVTGFDCPGCGSTRAFHALLHGHIFEAANYNILLLVFLPVIIAGLLNLYTQKSAIVWKIFNKPFFFLLVICIFWVLRNINLYPFTYLHSSR